MLLFAMTACTENGQDDTQNSGTILLPAGEKLVNVTWQDHNLWYATRTMSDKDSAQTYRFTKNLGETYILIEHR